MNDNDKPYDIGVNIGDVQQNRMTEAEAIERTAMGVKFLINKYHRTPCETAIHHDKTLYNPNNGLASRTAVLEEKAKMNQKMIWMVISGIVLSVLTLLITVVAPAVAGP